MPKLSFVHSQLPKLCDEFINLLIIKTFQKLRLEFNFVITLPNGSYNFIIIIKGFLKVRLSITWTDDIKRTKINSFTKYHHNKSYFIGYLYFLMAVWWNKCSKLCVLCCCTKAVASCILEKLQTTRNIFLSITQLRIKIIG